MTHEFVIGGEGIYPNTPAEIYHATDAASNSRLAEIDRSPAHCRAAIDNPRDPTEALITGDAAHFCILQPHLFPSRYVVAGRCCAIKTSDKQQCRNDGNVSIGGAWYCGVHAKRNRHKAGFDAATNRLIEAGYAVRTISESGSRYFQHPNGNQARVSDHEPNAKTLQWMIYSDVQDIRVDRPPYGDEADARRIISQDVYDQCRFMADAVRRHKRARELLELAETVELSIKAFDTDTGLMVKGRLDVPVFGHGVVGDVKTTNDASAPAFERSITDYHYDSQAALYPWLCARNDRVIDEFCFIVVEKSRPFGVAVYCLDSDVQALGLAQWRRRLDLYAKCLKAKRWPGYPEDVQRIGIAGYQRKRIEDRLNLDSESNP